MGRTIRGSSLSAGELCVFRTSPGHPSELAPPVCHAGLKVLAVGEWVIWAVLDGLFPEPPTLDELARAPVLCQHRFSMAGMPAVLACPPEWEIDLDGFAVLGRVPVSPPELALVPPLRTMAPWVSAGRIAEMEWRWTQDREALGREVAAEKAEREARWQAEREREAVRLRHLTWDRWLDEEPLGRWPNGAGSAGFVAALRSALRGSAAELRALGDRPGRSEARAVLRALVLRINALDEAEGEVIGTEEREDLLAAIEELAVLARQRCLTGEVEGWRTW